MGRPRCSVSSVASSSSMECERPMSAMLAPTSRGWSMIFGGMEGAADDDADAPATGADPDHGDRRRCQRGCRRDRARHPLGGRSAFRAARPQAENRRHGRHIPEETLAVMCSMAGRWSDQDIAALEPNGNADRSRQDLDGAPSRVAAPGTWHPRLPLRREERRVVDIARSGRKARCQPSSSSQAHQGRRPGQRADHARRTSPDPCGRPRKRTGRCRAQAQRPPVSADPENQTSMFPDT